MVPEPLITPAVPVFDMVSPSAVNATNTSVPPGATEKDPSAAGVKFAE